MRILLQLYGRSKVIHQAHLTEKLYPYNYKLLPPNSSLASFSQRFRIHTRPFGYSTDINGLLYTSFQEFMHSEGIDLNEPESKPTDPYMESRHQPQYCYTTPSTYDKLRKFLELDRNVLRFYCVWDDRDNMFGEIKPYVSPSTLLRTCLHRCQC